MVWVRAPGQGEEMCVSALTECLKRPAEYVAVPLRPQDQVDILDGRLHHVTVGLLLDASRPQRDGPLRCPVQDGPRLREEARKPRGLQRRHLAMGQDPFVASPGYLLVADALVLEVKPAKVERQSDGLGNALYVEVCENNPVLVC